VLFLVARNFSGPAELITAHGNGSLYAVLNAMNTLELKCFCEECKVPRSGAKYKILALLLAHVYAWTRA